MTSKARITAALDGQPTDYVPLVPLNDSTKGLVTAKHIQSLPKGCLVVLVTRVKICDVDAIRERVLADELALAADVWDVEPLPLDDPLLGRHNVVHTPHIAGRTMDANREWVEMFSTSLCLVTSYPKMLKVGPNC